MLCRQMDRQHIPDTHFFRRKLDALAPRMVFWSCSALNSHFLLLLPECWDYRYASPCFYKAGFLKKSSWALEVHTYNPSYLGG
jgi:hypothetical protein